MPSRSLPGRVWQGPGLAAVEVLAALVMEAKGGGGRVGGEMVEWCVGPACDFGRTRGARLRASGQCGESEGGNNDGNGKRWRVVERGGFYSHGEWRRGSFEAKEGGRAQGNKDEVGVGVGDLDSRFQRGLSIAGDGARGGNMVHRVHWRWRGTDDREKGEGGDKFGGVGVGLTR